MRISVYVTSYNQAPVLGVAVDSLLAQTRRPDQIVIVDDASTDGSQQLIRSYQERYPQLIHAVLRASNGGVATARNDALAAANGDVLCYLDGDDAYLPDKLASEAAALERQPSAGIAFSDYFNCDDRLQPLERWAGELDPPQGEVLAQVYARWFPRRVLFRHEMVRLDAWREVGGYDPALEVWEDFEMKVRLASRLRTVYVAQPLALYRRWAAGLSRTSLPRQLRALAYIRDKHAGLLHRLGSAQRRRAIAGLDEFRASLIRAELLRNMEASAPAAVRLRTLRLLQEVPASAKNLVAAALMLLPRQVARGILQVLRWRHP